MNEKKRHRRTKEELDEIIWNALKKQVVERGFNNITLVGLAKEAGVEPPVIYKRFEDLDELLEKYARKYDFWLNDILKFKKEYTANENIKKLLTDLINELYDNDVMQRLLLWGLNDTHRITRRLAMSREMDSADLITYFNSQFPHFEGIGAIMITGIYYLILQRRIATFCYIDYNTPQGKQNLIDSIGMMVDKLFPGNTVPNDDRIMEIAKKLLENGVDKNIIKDSTGLSVETIAAVETRRAT